MLYIYSSFFQLFLLDLLHTVISQLKGYLVAWEHLIEELRVCYLYEKIWICFEQIKTTCAQSPFFANTLYGYSGQLRRLWLPAFGHILSSIFFHISGQERLVKKKGQTLVKKNNLQNKQKRSFGKSQSRWSDYQHVKKRGKREKKCGNWRWVNSGKDSFLRVE